MDPNVTWKELMAAVQADDKDQIMESASALYDWLWNGGFTPELDSSEINFLLRQYCNHVGLASRL